MCLSKTSIQWYPTFSESSHMLLVQISHVLFSNKKSSLLICQQKKKQIARMPPHTSFTKRRVTCGGIIKLMKGKALRKHSLHEKTAASVLLKLFISSNEWWHTTDAPPLARAEPWVPE